MKTTTTLLKLLALGAALAFASCNTVQGVGKDIEKTGDAIQRGSGE